MTLPINNNGSTTRTDHRDDGVVSVEPRVEFELPQHNSGQNNESTEAVSSSTGSGKFETDSVQQRLGLDRDTDSIYISEKCGLVNAVGRGGLAMTFDAGSQSASRATPYNVLCDIDPEKPSVWEKLPAIERGFFPERQTSTADPYWFEAPREAVSEVVAFVFKTCEDPSLDYCRKLLLEPDSKAGMPSP